MVDPGEDVVDILNRQIEAAERYTQIKSELDVLRARQHTLEKKAAKLLDELRYFIARLNARSEVPS